MREILFRGKRTDNGEWVEGSLIVFPDEECFICSPSDETDALDKFWVRSETVGQYTGLTDKNGKKIFEGDIVHVHDRLLRYDAHFHEFDGKVEHRDTSFVIVSDIFAHYRWIDYECEIIGNIHDNPELLEEIVCQDG